MYFFCQNVRYQIMCRYTLAQKYLQHQNEISHVGSFFFVLRSYNISINIYVWDGRMKDINCDCSDRLTCYQ